MNFRKMLLDGVYGNYHGEHRTEPMFQIGAGYMVASELVERRKTIIRKLDRKENRELRKELVRIDKMLAPILLDGSVSLEKTK